MSSTNKTANYELSQFVGTDIPSILNDYNGDMRKIDTAIKAVANAEGSSASDIAGLQATVGQHTTEISGLNSTVNNLSGRVVGIEGKIPANASEDNKLITAQDIPEIPSVEQIEQNVANLQTSVGDLQEEVSDMGGDVKAIQLCIPANASESNKFATMSDIGGSGELESRVTTLENSVDDIETMIPSTAGENNKFATASQISSINQNLSSYNSRITNLENSTGNELIYHGDIKNMHNDTELATYITNNHSALMNGRKVIKAFLYSDATASTDYLYGANESIISNLVATATALSFEAIQYYMSNNSFIVDSVLVDCNFNSSSTYELHKMNATASGNAFTSPSGTIGIALFVMNINE